MMVKSHLVIAGVVIFLLAWWARGKWPTALAIIPVVGA